MGITCQRFSSGLSIHKSLSRSFVRSELKHSFFSTKKKTINEQNETHKSSQRKKERKEGSEDEFIDTL